MTDTKEYDPIAAAQAAAGEEGAPWKYNTLDDWMQGWFLKVVFRYNERDRHWCKHWYQHRYATERLTSLWRAWEEMYPQHDLASSWWTYHFDAHWRELTGEKGPFRDCTEAHAEDANASLPADSVPAGWPMPEVPE